MGDNRIRCEIQSHECAILSKFRKEEIARKHTYTHAGKGLSLSFLGFYTLTAVNFIWFFFPLILTLSFLSCVVLYLLPHILFSVIDLIGLIFSHNGMFTVSVISSHHRLLWDWLFVFFTISWVLSKKKKDKNSKAFQIINCNFKKSTCVDVKWIFSFFVCMC